MSNPYLRSYDDLLQAMLTDYSNLSPSPDTSIGSPVYIKCSVLASALWGVYKYQDYLAQQPFPDTGSTDSINHWGSILGITRQAGENDNDYANAMITALKSPPAGGTKTDYQNWALQMPAQTAYHNENFLPGAVNVGADTITVGQNYNMDGVIVQFTTTGTLPGGLSLNTSYGVYQAYADPSLIQVWDTGFISPVTLTNGGSGLHTIVPQSTTTYFVQYCTVITPPAVPAGQVYLVIKPNDLSILGTGAMTNLVTGLQMYVDARRPVTAASTVIQAVALLVQNVSVTVSPVTSDIQTMQNDIASFMSSMLPGDTLYTSKLESICIQDGAVNAVVTTPTSDVVPQYYQVIQPGIISVTPSA